MPLQVNVSEVPDSEDEPLTSSPVKYSDALNNACPASHRVDQGPDDTPPNAVCFHQASCDSIPLTAPGHGESLMLTSNDPFMGFDMPGVVDQNNSRFINVSAQLEAHVNTQSARVTSLNKLQPSLHTPMGDGQSNEAAFLRNLIITKGRHDGEISCPMPSEEKSQHYEDKDTLSIEHEPKLEPSQHAVSVSLDTNGRAESGVTAFLEGSAQVKDSCIEKVELYTHSIHPQQGSRLNETMGGVDAAETSNIPTTMKPLEAPISASVSFPEHSQDRNIPSSNTSTSCRNESTLPDAIPETDHSHLEVDAQTPTDDANVKPESSITNKPLGPDKPKSAAKTPQETLVDELKAQKAALIASLAALPQIKEMLGETQSLSASRDPEAGPNDAVVMAAANKIVKKHIKLLHQYNEIKDVGQGLMGLIADQRGVRIIEVQDEFGISPKD